MYGDPTYNPIPLASQNANAEKYACDNSLDPGNGATSPLVSQAFQHGFLPGSTFKMVTSAAVYDHQPALAKLDIPDGSAASHCPSRTSCCCNYAGSTGCTRRAAALITSQTTSRSRATPHSPAGHGRSAASADHRGRGVRVQPAGPASTSPAPGCPASRPRPNSINNKPTQAYSAFGQQNVVATALQMGLVADGIADRGVIMTPHVMQHIRDSQGNLVDDLPTPPVADGHQPVDRGRGDLADAGRRHQRDRGQVVFPPTGDVAAKTGTAETGRVRSAAHQRLDDRLRPGQRPEGGGGRGRCRTRSPSATGASISGPADRRPSSATHWRPRHDRPDRTGRTSRRSVSSTPEPSDSRHRL